MSQPDIRDALFDAVSVAMMRHGVEGLSLRALTQSVGKSTSVVFQLFGGKDGLLRAAMAGMLERDRHYHDALRQSLEGLPLAEPQLRTIILAYLRERARDATARAWLEAVYKHRLFPGIAPLVHQWQTIRDDFWARLLAGTCFAPLGPLLGAYLLAEEVYASALIGRLDYELVLEETVAGLLRGCAGTHDAAQPRGSGGLWAEPRAFADPVASAPDMPPSLEGLMEAAVAQIIHTGATGLNLKQLAASLDQAPSQIVYHFGDFASFRRQAIWRALMHALPAYLDRNRAHGQPDLGWAAELALTTRPGVSARPAGFYVNYSRTLGQTCLLAAIDPTVGHFALQLRVIEGNGIHNASQTNWDAEVRLGRDTATAFALWIKGRAILNEALSEGAADDGKSDALPIAAMARVLAEGRAG